MRKFDRDEIKKQGPLNPTRRRFFGQIAAGASAAGLSPLARARADIASPPAPPAAPKDGPAFFTDEERAILETLAEEILPGAADMGAPAYIEQLMTAFEFDPPRIFAGGPYSGRNPFPAGWGGQFNDSCENSFADFLPLNRQLAAAWRIKLYGSDAAAQLGITDPNASKLGKVKGLRDLLKTGAQKEIKARKNPFVRWIRKRIVDPIENLFGNDFESTLAELVIEGCLAAPEYGGNRELKGWAMVNYLGDTAPRGYTCFDPAQGAYIELPDAPTTKIDPGKDPAPLGFWNKILFKGVSIVLGGNPK